MAERKRGEVMMLVQQIKKEVADLPKVQLKEFRSWFEEFDASEWDKQFEKDVASGKLENIANRAVSDFKKGKFKKL
jgi:hypothetical protein